ncbi:ATP-binding protein [Desulfoferrobacter suflitae]|uniref:ATP-binding protein n=1 Tax=Desulfoferrobacter suflitae TaxID=2865782 RepID=UPI0021645CC3|nr:ATP-binding protein [Desulfoferrobacter suflitae]MCK8601167.1 ATP-binding protein [Desulfoferrobacter suflitae]
MKHSKQLMNIAVIGGGKRCKAFLEMLDAKRFPRLQAQIVAVADINDTAAGIQLARQKGIFTTRDYHDFFAIKDLDLVIELTGNEVLLEDFLKRKPARLKVLESAISRLFSDIVRFREEYLLEKRQLEMVQGIVDSIFSSIQDRVLIMQPDLRILDANQALLDSVGMTKDEIIGKYCYQVSHQATGPCSERGDICPLAESIETGGMAHAIHEHFDRNSQMWYCEVTTMPLKNSQGKVDLVLEILRDITDELENRVEQKTRSLTMNLTRLIHEDKMIALGKLVASSVHEINNPLSGIHALARLVHRGLEEEPLTPENLAQYKYYLQLIDTESARCSHIVSNLLSFSRQQKMERKPFQINEIIHKVVSLFGHKMELQEVKLHLDLEDDLPEMVGDPSQIQQCIVNLFFNAMESMPNGGDIAVRTRWEDRKNLIRLEVEDSGVGIPEEMLSQIFEPFFSTKNQDKGVGLGLSVVYGIIKEHHGSIYVKSEVGKGSNFIVRFFPIPEDATCE